MFPQALLVLSLVPPPTTFTDPGPPLCASVVPAEEGDEQYNYIAGLFEQGFHELVLKEASGFVEKFPRHSRIAKIRYRLGQSLFELGRHKDAEATLLPLEKEGDSFEFAREVRFRVAQCALKLGDTQAAISRFEGLGEDSSHYLSEASLYYAGEAHFQTGDYSGARRNYASLLKRNEASEYARSALYGLCWSSYRTGDDANAVDALRIFLSKFPEDPATPEIRFLLGECLSRLQRWDEAVEAYTSVPQGEYLDDALSGAGFAAAQAGDSEKAAQLFAKVEQLCPQSALVPQARLHCGIHYYRCDRLKPSAQALDRLIEGKDDKHRCDAYYWRGLVERKQRDAKSAVPFLEKALESATEAESKKRAARALGDALFDAGDFDRARSLYAQHGEGSRDVQYSAAVAALNSGKLDEAIAAAHKVVEGPADSLQRGAQLVLGEAHFARRDYTTALPAFEAVLKGKAEDDEARTQRERALSRAGWCHFLSGRFEPAAREFARLLQEFPESAFGSEAALMCGRSLLAAGKAAECERVLEGRMQAFEQTDLSDDASFELARARLSLQKTELALEGFETVAEDDGADKELRTRAFWERGEIHSARGEHDQSLESYESLLKLKPQGALFVSALYAHAYAAFQLGRWDDARRSLNALSKMESLDKKTEVAALELLVSTERSAGRADACVAAFERMRERCPEDASTANAVLVAVAALRKADRIPDARALLEDAQARWPKSSCHDRIELELGLCCKDLKQSDAALAALSRLITEHGSSPLCPEASFHKGELLFDQGRYDEALKSYDGALGKDLRVADVALYKSGWCELRLDRLPQAAERFRRVSSAHPDSLVAGESLFLAGESCYRRKDYAGAAQDLLSFIERFPQHESRSKALFRMGLALAELKRFDAAIAAIVQLEKETPSFEHKDECNVCAGVCLLELGRVKEAQRRFESVIEHDKTTLSARAHLGLGRCHLAEKETQEALGEFLKVSLLYQTPEEVSESLWWSGQCLEAMKDSARAAERYRELLQKFPDSAWAKAARERLARLQL